MGLDSLREKACKFSILARNKGSKYVKRAGSSVAMTGNRDAKVGNRNATSGSPAAMGGDFDAMATHVEASAASWPERSENHT